VQLVSNVKLPEKTETANAEIKIEAYNLGDYDTLNSLYGTVKVLSTNTDAIKSDIDAEVLWNKTKESDGGYIGTITLPIEANVPKSDNVILNFLLGLLHPFIVIQPVEVAGQLTVSPSSISDNATTTLTISNLPTDAKVIKVESNTDSLTIGQGQTFKNNNGEIQVEVYTKVGLFSAAITVTLD